MVSRILFGLLFVAWVGEWPRELDSSLYSGLWRSPFEVFAPFFVPLPGIRLLAWQLLLIALVPVCLAMPGAFQYRAREMDAAIFVSLASIAITFLWGLMNGGGAYEAYYQLWRFMVALLLGYLLPVVLRTGREFRALAVTILIAALIRGTLVMYFYWAHVRGRITGLEYMTNHDDSLLFVSAILIVGSWALIKGGNGTWTIASFISLYLFYAMALNDRRIAWMELAMAVVVIYVLMGASPLRRRINRWMIVLAPILLVYMVVGWGREGAIFAPIRSFSTVGSNADLSSLARMEEDVNLLYTMSIAGNPLLGTGWGIPYQKLTSYWNNYAAEWVLAFYTPHNSLLGLAVFSGLVGILGIWLVVPMAAFLAARGYARSTHPIYRAAAMVAAGILPAYSVHCFGDIGLQSFAGGLILGVALGTAGKVAALAAAPAAPDEASGQARSRGAPLRAVYGGVYRVGTRSGDHRAPRPLHRSLAGEIADRADDRLPPRRRTS